MTLDHVELDTDLELKLAGSPERVIWLQLTRNGRLKTTKANGAYVNGVHVPSEIQAPLRN